jgi:hypothetical protein
MHSGTSEMRFVAALEDVLEVKGCFAFSRAPARRQRTRIDECWAGRRRLDWARLTASMGGPARSVTCAEFAAQFRPAMKERGRPLTEAAIFP